MKRSMLPDELIAGREVRHPVHGVGRVQARSGEQEVEVVFADGIARTLTDGRDLRPCSGADRLEDADMETRLDGLLDSMAEATLGFLGLRPPRPPVIPRLDRRWRGGSLQFSPGDESLPPVRLPLEECFRQILHLREQLALLEERLLSQPDLPERERANLVAQVRACRHCGQFFDALFES